jgi:multicomponent Na+:H+ antiporter subunit D
VGIPPLSGFWPKISLITASFDSESYWSLAAIIFASFITLVVIAKLWAEVFWKDATEIPVRPKFRYYHKIKNIKRIQIVVPIVFLSLVSLYIGFGAEHIQRLSTRIASELMDNQQYIDAVLNTQTPD